MGLNFKSILGGLAPIAGMAANAFLPGSGGIVSGIMGGLGGAGKNTAAGGPTSVQAPWAPQGAAVQDLYNRGKTWMDQFGGTNAAEKSGIEQMQNYNTTGLGGQVSGEFAGTGRNLASQGYNAAQNFLGQNAQNAGIDMNVMGQAANNPYAQQSIDAMAGDVNRNLQRNILPSIRNQAGGRGLIGSTRAGVAEGLASSDATRQIGDLAQKYRSDMYNNALAMGGQFGMTNSAAQNARQLQQAQLGANLGGAGMGYLGAGAEMGQNALKNYMGASGMERDITGGALDRYQKIAGTTPGAFESSGMTPATDKTANIVTGIGAGLNQFATNNQTAQKNAMDAYKFQQDYPNYKAPTGFNLF